MNAALRLLNWITKNSGEPAETPPTHWDPELSANCLPALNTPSFEEDAVIRAFKILEGRLRGLLAAPAERTGTQLAEEAFGKDGPLQLGKTPAEQLGLLRLFSGVFLLNRNASTHRFINYSKAEAAQIIGFVNLLLRWLDRGLEGTTRELGILKKEDQAVRYLFHDLDGDGVKERIISIQRADTDVSTCKLICLRQTPSGLTSITLLEDQPASSLDCQIRDINGDGRPELIARSTTSERSEWIHVWQWDTNGFRELTGGGIYSDYPRIEIKDVDGDGIEEIVGYKRQPDLPQTAQNLTITTYHWNGNQFQGSVSREEIGPYRQDTDEDRVKRMVLTYEPAAEAFVRAVNAHPGTHVSWWIDKRLEKGREVWRVQLRQWSDRTTLGQTFNHYSVDLAAVKVTSMFFHHPDGTLTSDPDW
ncbi:MAG TPA: TIGR02391 family protein [Elusimicrobiota bacterium]|nr:TIGR02391 family protein [Elusimicrobiota bacterium]